MNQLQEIFSNAVKEEAVKIALEDGFVFSELGKFLQKKYTRKAQTNIRAYFATCGIV